MSRDFKKQNVFVIFLLIIITGGVYSSFWFKNIAKSFTDIKNSIALNPRVITIFILVSIIYFIAGIVYYRGGREGMDFSIIRFSFGYKSISSLSSTFYWIFVVTFSLSLRKILSSKLQVKINPILTFIFGPLYLQYSINKYLESQKSNS